MPFPSSSSSESIPSKPRSSPLSIPLVPSPASDPFLTYCAYLLPTLESLLLPAPSSSSSSSPPPDLQVLDVGCGSGRLTASFTQHLLHLLHRHDTPVFRPNSLRVTGLDLSPAILTSARTHTRLAFPEIPETCLRFVPGSALALPFPAESFQLVHVHQVLSHVSDPITAIREILRVTRVGGVIGLREGDLGSVRIGATNREVVKLLEEFYRVLGEVQRREGGSADGGMKLMEWVCGTGVEKGKVERSFSVSWYDSLEKRRAYAGYWPARCTGGMFAEKALEAGVKRKQLEQYAKAWTDWIQDDDAFLTMMHGEVIVRL